MATQDSQSGVGPTRSAEIRSRLDHPVVDADGHAIETGYVFLDYLKQVAGPDLRDRYVAFLDAGGWFGMTPDQRRRHRVFRPSSWTLPTQNTLDRATAMLPRLFRERMDDFGIDFSIVYSTMALGTTRMADEELRRATCRALNTMFADLFADQADRMTPVAAIPAHTPDEAITELDHAVTELGFKAAMIASNIRRPIEAVADTHPEFARYASWMDTLCMESPYDYDPLWARCVDHKVAVTSHSPATGWGSRVVSTHYIHNHVGSFAASGEAFAKALVLGGVTKRFPTLNFAFLEGGVAWACELYAGLVSHCGKRNPKDIRNYDPRNIDTERLAELCAEYGTGVMKERLDPTDPDFARSPVGWNQDKDDLIAQELEALGIEAAEDLRRLFEPNFYFGCEADDPLVALAFDGRMMPFGARLKATFSSDIGHWDVPDMTLVLAEAYELVEKGLLDMDAFREFVFVNPAMLHAGMNREFFAGTNVEDAVSELFG